MNPLVTDITAHTPSRGNADPRYDHPTNHNNVNAEVNAHSLALLGKLDLAGGTMTGPLLLNRDPVSSNETATKSYVDARVGSVGSLSAAWGSITGLIGSQGDLQTALGTKLSAASNLTDLTDPVTARTSLGLGDLAVQSSSFVNITGGVISGVAAIALISGGTGSSTAAGARTNLGVPADSAVVHLVGNETIAGTKSFTSVPNAPSPVAATDLANKNYVDSLANGLTVKAPARAASVSNITIATPGATIDGVTLAPGDRVLLKAQATASQNGLYVFNGASSAMTRTADAATSAQVQSGMYVFITEGSTEADTAWVLTTPNPIVVGTTSLAYTQFSGAATSLPWGSITGSLSSQTDLQTALNTKLTASNNLSDLTAASTARTNLGVAIGSNVQAWSANLDALGALSTVGLMTQTAAGVYAGRSVAAGSGMVTVTNGSGAAGNPTIDVIPGNFTGIPEAGITGLVTDLAAKLAVASNLSDVASPAVAFGNIKQAATAGATGVLQLAGDLTGTATAPLLKRASRVFNPSDYGTYHLDGSTDDGPVVQAAVDAAHGAGGGDVELGFGISFISTHSSPAGFSFPLYGLKLYSNVTVRGHGKKSSVLTTGAIGSPISGEGYFTMFLNDDAAAGADNIHVFDIGVRLPVPTTDGSGNLTLYDNAYEFRGCHNSSVERCYMLNGSIGFDSDTTHHDSANALTLGNSYNNKILYCDVDNAVGSLAFVQSKNCVFAYNRIDQAWDDAFLIGSAGTGHKIIYNWINAASPVTGDSATTASIYLLNDGGCGGQDFLADITVEGNTIFGNNNHNHGVQAGIGVLGNCRDVDISSNDVSTCMQGILIGAGSGATKTGVRLRDNKVHSNAGDGIYAESVTTAVTGLAIIGNEVWNNTGPGIHLYSNGTIKALVTNNHCYDDQGSPTQTTSLYAASESGKTLDTAEHNNSFENTTGFAASGPGSAGITHRSYVYDTLSSTLINSRMVIRPAAGSYLQLHTSSGDVAATVSAGEGSAVAAYHATGTTYAFTAYGSADTSAPALRVDGNGTVSIPHSTTAIGLNVTSSIAQTANYLVQVANSNASTNVRTMSVSTAGSSHALSVSSSNATPQALEIIGQLTLVNGSDIVLGSAAGTKIGTSGTQKLAFYNSTPIVQPTGDVITALTNLGLVATPTISESDVTNLTSDLALKAPLASPALTGTPTAPTATPSTNSTQLATTAYTDAAVAAMAAGLNWKASVRAATTANGTLATAYANGQVIDGVTLATGNRILLKNQTTGSENGVYIVAASGAPARSSDANSSSTLTANLAVFINEGTINGDTAWTLTNNGAITVGSTALTFTQFAGAGAAGTVTTVSVVSANGFAGTVANNTTTPAITLTTSITGLLKGNGTAISAATAGTDYSAGTSALATGILKSTTSTGALTIAVAGDFPTLNQNTSGSAATLTAPRAIYGNNFDGSAALSQIIASTYGGTGNGFTKFSGPATAEKTFTLPDASATLLYAGGDLGTPSAGVATNLTGTAASLTAGHVTNATLTTALTVNTGTLTLTASAANTSVLTIGGGAVSVSGSNTGDQTNISGNAATVTTNANLTGVITSSGNATSIASQTGTGTKFVVDTSPTLVTPVLGVATGTSLALTNTSATGLAVGANGSTNPTLQVDSSTASAATGILVKSAAAAAGVALSVITSGTNESLTVDAAGTGTVGINTKASNSGAVTIGNSTSLAGLVVNGPTLASIGSKTAAAFSFQGHAGYGMYFNTSVGGALVGNGADVMGIGSTGTVIPSGISMFFASGALGTSLDSAIKRVAAGMLSVSGGLIIHTPTNIDSTATATGAQVATGYITSTSAAAVTITLPTGTNLGTALGAVQGTILDLYIDNTAGANTVTLAVNTNAIKSAAAAANAASQGLLTIPSGVTGQACFRIMFSSATAYTFTRIA